MRRKILWAALGGLVTLGALGAYFALTPRSQPCWPRPEGSAPSIAASRPMPAPPPALRRPVTLIIGGDLMLGRGIDRRLAHNARYAPLSALRPGPPGAWWLFNLESVVSPPHPEWPWKMYRFRVAPERFTAAFAQGPIRLDRALVSVANNHTLDHGREGLAATLRQLDAAGVRHAGAGPNLDAAWAPAIGGAPGARVGLLAVADHCGCLDMCGWLATTERSGIAYAYLSGGERAPLLEATRRLRQQVEVVVVSLHAGPNYVDEVPEWLRATARAVVDAGADVVYAHSAHHVLPIERYAGRHLIYAPGDLLNDYTPRDAPRNDLGATVQITLTPGGEQSVEVRPHRIRSGRLLPLPPGDADGQAIRRSMLGQAEPAASAAAR